MAFEIKTLEIKNSEEDSTIRFWAQFGWSLKSSQRIYNKDSHLEKRGDEVYSVTETVDYTKLVFERDKAHPNYKQIVELETEYFAILNGLPKEVPTRIEGYSSPEEWAKKTGQDLRTPFHRAIGWISLIVGVGVFFGLEQYDSAFTMALQVVGALLAVGFFVWKAIFKKNALKKMEAGEEPFHGMMMRRYADFQKTMTMRNQAADAYWAKRERMDEIVDALEKII